MQFNYTYRFRLFPEENQLSWLNQQVGNNRFVYNYILDLSQKNYKENQTSWNVIEMVNSLPNLKKELPFLKISLSQSLQEAVFNLDKAYQRYFERLGELPVHKKKKKGKDSFYVLQDFQIYEEFGYIAIPKLKSMLKVNFHRKMQYNKIKKLTITKDKVGNWFVNILVERNIDNLPKTNINIGIDKNLNTINFGNHDFQEEVKTLKTLAFYAKRLKHLQKQLSKIDRLNNPDSFVKKGNDNKLKQNQPLTIFSKNREKVRNQIAQIYRKIRNIKQDFLHKLTTEIINRFDIICIEDLNIKGMQKNHNLAKAISEVSWGEFDRQLKYKALWYGKVVIMVDRFFASSKKCNHCNHLNKDLKLGQKQWTCKNCNNLNQRDPNAVLNILDEGLRLLENNLIKIKPKKKLRNRKRIGSESAESQEITRPLENPTMDDKVVEIQSLKSRGSMKEELLAI